MLSVHCIPVIQEHLLVAFMIFDPFTKQKSKFTEEEMMMNVKELNSD